MRSASTGDVMPLGADATALSIIGTVILMLAGLVVWTVKAIVSGGLVPRQTYDDLLTANTKMQERADLQTAQLAAQAEAIAAVRAMLESFPPASARRRAIGPPS